MANREQEHRGGSGNFAEDRERAREAGRKGGEHSHGSQQHSQSGGDDRQQGGEHGGQRGGSGNFANDPQRASEAGRKGGQH
jgi:general stress protein YciG